jgi:hypothetical protein
MERYFGLELIDREAGVIRDLKHLHTQTPQRNKRSKRSAVPFVPKETCESEQHWRLAMQALDEART